ncbi:Glutamate-1-semialdehyde 2,1-aminomutase OS=Lysinibacillus sphaericus OX=1421 GN=hemL_2 PE=4 SV=1 [Lysinibacillus sphaericus]
MIDLTMGFGLNVWTYPEFVRKALRNELEKGMPVGSTMGRLTGLVAQNISELAGVDSSIFL